MPLLHFGRTPPRKARPRSGPGRRAAALRAFAAVLVVSALSGCATPQQWGLEFQLKQLCAKEGGLTVYKPSVLPLPLALVAGKKQSMTSDQKYYEEYSSENIYSECADKASCLELVRHTTKLIDASTSELVAKKVDFSRLGGDWFFPSVSKCGLNPGWESLYSDWPKK